MSEGRPGADAPLRVLASGLTGQLGAGLVEAAGSALELVPLVRPAGRLSGGERVARRFPDRPELAERTVEGDVDEPGWGLADAPLDRLAGEVDAVLNLAAITNWAAPQRRLVATNLVGAHNGLTVAARLRERGGRCRVYCQTSSVHVAGGLVGSVPEARFGPDGERSAYEHSKWLAEELLAGAAEEAGLVVGIARVGGLIGSAETGVTARRNSLYQLAALWERMPGRFLPTVADGRVDILPRDVAGSLLADALIGLRRAPAPGVEVFHVCAGSAAPTLGAVLATLRSLDDGERFAGLRTVPTTYPVIRWTTQNLDRMWPFPAAWRNGIVGHRYVSTPRVFERDRLAALTGRDVLPAPPVELLVRLAFDLRAPGGPAAGRRHALARLEG